MDDDPTHRDGGPAEPLPYATTAQNAQRPRRVIYGAAVLAAILIGCIIGATVALTRDETPTSPHPAVQITPTTTATTTSPVAGTQLRPRSENGDEDEEGDEQPHGPKHKNGHSATRD